MAHSQRALVVTEGFGTYGRGDIIRDPSVIDTILQGANRARTVAIALPDADAGEQG